MRLGEVMTRDVEVIGSNAPLKEAAAKMKPSMLDSFRSAKEMS